MGAKERGVGTLQRFSRDRPLRCSLPGVLGGSLSPWFCLHGLGTSTCPPPSPCSAQAWPISFRCLQDQ